MTRAAGVLLAAVLALGAASPAPSPPPNVVTTLTLFAGTATGFLRSGDWGRTWQPVAMGSDVRPVGATRSILPLVIRVMVGGDGGLFVSPDFGVTWRALSADGPVLAVLPSRYPLADATVWVGTANGLFKSEDAGWTLKPTPITGTPVTRLDWPGPDLVVGCGKGVFSSVDGGLTFAGPGEGLPEGEVRALVVSSFYALDPVLFAGVADKGLFRSGDRGRTWQFAGLAGQQVLDLVWLGPQLYAATTTGVLRSDDSGRTWITGKGLTVPTHRLMFPLAPASSVEAFAATDDGVWHTGDAGATWEPWALRGQVVYTVATFPPPNPLERKKKR